MKIVVNMFQDEVVDKNNNTEVSKDFDSSTKETKKLVTLICENENKNKFVISKWLTISSSKSDDDYVKEAYDASKSEIDTWSASFTNIGKTFNPDTGKME
tara:strand:- start:12 stop:311 length:300 start_codon:yes stop_codon:yes gene_type:complete